MARLVLALLALTAVNATPAPPPVATQPCPAGDSWIEVTNSWKVTTVAGGMCYARRGGTTCLAKDGIGSTANFAYIYGISISKDGSFAIAADRIGRIVRVNPTTGEVTTVAGSDNAGYTDAVGAAAQFNNPAGVCISPDMSFVLVADDSNNRIRRVELVGSKAGEVTTLAGSSAGFRDGVGAAAKFSGPKGVAIASDGSFALATDMANGKVRHIDLKTNLVTTVGGALSSPWGVSIAADMSFALLAEYNPPRIRRMELPSFEMTTVYGSGVYTQPCVDGIGTAAGFGLVSEVEISSDMSFALVIERVGHTVRRIDLATGAVTTVAGITDYSGTNSQARGSANGVGSAASFSCPASVSIAPDMTWALIGEEDNYDIRKIILESHCKAGPKVFGSGIATAAQRANLKLAHDNYVTNTKASFTAAEPLYKQSVVEFGNTFGAGSFLTKSAKKRYNILLARDSIKAAAEQALADNTPFAAAELVETKVHHQGRCASALPTSATYTAQSKRTVNPDMAGSVVLVTCADGLEATPEGDHVVVFLSCDSKLDTDLYEWVAHGTCRKKFQATHAGAYCANRVWSGGGHFSTTNVGANNIEGCSDFVAAEPLCGRKFSYGSNDGWCDCIPLAGGSDGSDTCGPVYPKDTSYSAYQNSA